VRRYQDPAAVFGPIDEEHENRSARFEASFDRVGARAAFRAAAGVVADRLVSTTDGDRSRDAAHVRAQASSDRLAFARALRFVGAARLDAIEGFDLFASPRLGIVLDAVPRHVRFSTSAGLAFRPPSFDELFWPPRASAAGNPDLRAERGRDVDATAELESLPLEGRVSVSAFARRRRSHRVVPRPGRGLATPRARLAGIEGDLRLRVGLDASMASS
jgi:outer membrane receptor protein involved in Fe transport